MIRETPTAEVSRTHTSDEQHQKKEKETAAAAPAAGAVTPGASSKQIMITPTLPKHKEHKTIVTESIKSDIEVEDKVSEVKPVEKEEEKSSSSSSTPTSSIKEKEENQVPPSAPPPPPPPPTPASSVVAEGAAVKKDQEAEHKDTINPSPSFLEEEDNTVVNEEREGEKKENEKKGEVSSPLEVIAAVKEEEIKEKEAVEKEKLEEEVVEDVAPKLLPLRTAEAEAALERIRAIQQRRQDLYDRAIARQENKLKPLSAMSSDDTTTVGETLPLAPPLPSGSRYVNEAPVENNLNDSIDNDSIVEGLDIPEGMSLLELRERAVAANKAAAASATAAHRAASASALAADAADTAIHAAQQASLAATRCQNALDLRSADAIEEAFKAATNAEEKAETASRTAAVNSAKAVISKREAEKKEHIATKAAELSTPHGIVAQTSAFWRQLRRDTATAAEVTHKNVEAGAAAAGWMWNEGSAKVQYVGKGVVDGVQNVWKAVEERLPAAPVDSGKEKQRAPVVVEKGKKSWGREKVAATQEEPVKRGWFGRNKAKK